MALIKINNRSSEDNAVHGRRNLIINGDAQIWQRGTSSSSTGVNSADRWYHTEGTFSQETSIVPTNFQYAIKCVTNASNTPLLLQKIERPQVCGHIVGQDITVSFYARSSNVNAITKLELNDEGGSGGRPDGGAQTLSAADTWERITHTFTAPFSSLTGSSVAVVLTFANSATVYITGFQVEVGDSATPFEHRSYEEELIACQRYYAELPCFSGPGTGTTDTRGYGAHVVQMRVAPTLGVTGVMNITDGYSYDRTQSSASISLITNTVDFSFFNLPNFSSMTGGRIHFGPRNQNANRVTLDSEL